MNDKEEIEKKNNGGPCCRDCVFFERQPLDLNNGKCNRYPPTPFMIITERGASVNSSYPPVKTDNRPCGEFRSVIDVASNIMQGDD
jgi:hypothetical protein